MKARILKLTDIDGRDVIANFDEIEEVRALGGGYHHGAQCYLVFKSGRVESVREAPDRIVQMIEAFTE